MSIIAFGELRFGAGKSRNGEKALAKLERLAEIIPVLLLPSETSTEYGRIRAALERDGTPVGANDLWIAAHAPAENLTLVSNNTREFKRVPGLSLENRAKRRAIFAMTAQKPRFRPNSRKSNRKGDIQLSF